MLVVGDLHVYVSDLSVALRFWSAGLGLREVDREQSGAAGFALLEFPDGGPSLRLFTADEPWGHEARPPTGARPTIRFDLVTTDFDGTLVRLLEHEGQQVDEIEEYEGLRVVTVADPDGNEFLLVEASEDAK